MLTLRGRWGVKWLQIVLQTRSAALEHKLYLGVVNKLVCNTQ